MFRKVLFAAVLLAQAVGAAIVPGRYIVELTMEPVAEHVARPVGRARLSGAEASSHRVRVRAEHQRLRRELALQDAEVLDGVETIANALFVRVPDDAAARRLASMAGVKRVVPVRTFHMLLDRAAVLHKAADAWSRIGDGQAGLGAKIAIIDSGIDAGHPGFQDSSLVAPDSFPRFTNATDSAFTNGKIIVARSYVSLLPNRDPDHSARDHVGHGTALAMAAAGVRTAGPRATISGIAPKAYLGSYKVFGTPGYNDGSTDDAILKALDDAVADGMDIINLSLGDELAPRLVDDPEVQAIERATRAGVIVVVAAGNNGPGLNTMSSPATAPSAITVGASTNDRTYASSVEVPGLTPFLAVAGNGATPPVPVTALIVDVSSLDSNGQACSPLPADSLTERVALILRGSCTFETKLLNARQAGAMAALLYATQESPSPIAMAVGTATLPAEMIGYEDGMAIRQALAAQPSLVGTLRFTLSAVPVQANRITDFSAAGPSVDLGIKPDLLAVGGDVYTATQTADVSGDMYDSSGFILVDGTSFSAPMVAGAAALIRSARPGLSADQYRSLLINTAAAAEPLSTGVPSVHQAGAGVLDVDAALRSTVTAYPASLSLGAGGPDPQITRTLTISNVGTASQTFWVGATGRPGAPVPAIAENGILVAPGASIDVGVAWKASGLAAGPYEGFITVTDSASGTAVRVPYWYAVTSGEPAAIKILDSVDSARRGSSQRDAVLFRITDVSGVALADIEPQVTVVSGGGTVRRIASHDSSVPGLFGVDVQLGLAAGANVFRIQAGAVATDVSIAGQ